MNKLLWNLGVFCLSGFVVFLSSCEKEESTRAIITVVDTDGNAVASSSVTLHQDQAIHPVTGSQANIRVTELTGADGTAEFDFELEAYLNIDASKGAYAGQAFVRLKQGETVSQTVVIR